VNSLLKKGIGNGISILIFAGIVSQFGTGSTADLSFTTIRQLNIFVVLANHSDNVLALIVGIVALEEGQRRIPVQYAKRVVGRKMYGGQSTHIPFKVNQSGVVPVIFASTLLMFPSTIAGFIDHPVANWIAGVFAPGTLCIRFFMSC
jgi:preprotein translocase subunit SecY